MNTAGKFIDVTSDINAQVPTKMKEFIAWAKKEHRYSKEEAVSEFKRMKRTTVWQSEKYVVHVCPPPSDLPDNETPWTHLSIRNLDRTSKHDWREFQDIKNQLLGEDVEGIELYPSNDRLLDQCNQFHLWCLPSGDKIPCGRTVGRLVEQGPVSIGSSQRDEHGIDWFLDSEGVLVELPN